YQIVKLKISFAHEAQVRYLIHQVGGRILKVDYKTDVRMTIEVEQKVLETFVESLGVYAIVEQT
ncbi:DUF1949 domain-containing protein, partial [Streptococcus pneumoniae]